MAPPDRDAPHPAALLDVDGTLVDTTFHHAVAWWRACRDAGIELPVWRLHRLIGKGSDQLLESILGPEEAEARHEELTSRWEQHWEVVRGEVRALPGAPQLVRALADGGLRVVCATSGREEDVDAMQDLIGAGASVHAVVNASEVVQSKPAPDIFRLALERAGSAASHAVVVGDTVWDAEAAAACGVPSIGVRSGGVSDAELRGAGVLAVYDDAADLLANLAASPLGPLLPSRRT